MSRAPELSRIVSQKVLGQSAALSERFATARPFRHVIIDGFLKIFETNEYSGHGFERIALPPERQHLSRKSFALYFYTATRPATETTEEHSTVYVDRHLPERFQPGLTLDGDDMQVIRLLMARVWDLEHSLSWRITTPLRAVKRLLSGSS